MSTIIYNWYPCMDHIRTSCCPHQYAQLWNKVYYNQDLEWLVGKVNISLLRLSYSCLPTNACTDPALRRKPSSINSILKQSYKYGCQYWCRCKPITYGIRNGNIECIIGAISDSLYDICIQWCKPRIYIVYQYSYVSYLISICGRWTIKHFIHTSN